MARKPFRIVTATQSFNCIRLFHIILNYGVKRFGYRPKTMISTNNISSSMCFEIEINLRDVAYFRLNTILDEFQIVEF